MDFDPLKLITSDAKLKHGEPNVSTNNSMETKQSIVTVDGENQKELKRNTYENNSITIHSQIVDAIIVINERKRESIVEEPGDKHSNKIFRQT